MKNIKVKYGTKSEILKYITSKSKGHKDFEDKIDDAIKSGSPFVTLPLRRVYPCEYEFFLIEDYSDLRLDFEMNKLDDEKSRSRKLQLMEMLLDMESEAKDLWNRILKVVEEYKGRSL